MKVYVMTDMEGVSGVSSHSFVEPGQKDYEAGRRFLTGDVRAAVEGAFDGGATDVVVNDGHGGGPHIIMDESDTRARYVTPADAGNCAPELDGSVDVCFIIGAHAMAGTRDAFLDHTQDPGSVFSYSVAGKEMGEIGQCAVLAGSFGVPVTLVSGDKAACEEARQLLGKSVEAVSVKTGVGREDAICRHPKAAQGEVRQAAARATKLADEVDPFIIEFPVEVRLTFHMTNFADHAAQLPGVERLDARTVRMTAKEASAILLGFM